MAPPQPIETKHTVHDLPTPGPESPFRERRPYRFSTLCATVENPHMKDQYGSSAVPIYQTATFKGGPGGEYDYTRSGNPTRSHLQHHIAKISSANHAFTVSSGMAALDVILRLLKPGDEVIAGDDIYGGTHRLLTYIRTQMGVTIHHVDTTNPANLHPYIRADKTAMVLLESPTNPCLKIADLATIAQDVKERAPNALVYDSGTKYLSGHHDLMAGAITCNRDDIAQKLAFTINSVGNALTPIDSFLLLRGIKTLALRMDRQQATTQLVAEYLHNLGFKVNYPGLVGHPGREVHMRIADGNGAVLSFETGNKEISEKIVAATRLWGISVSFGCVNSLINTLPSTAATRAARGLPEDLIRLCVGIEDSNDLLDDLEHALLEAGAIELNAAQNKFVRAPNPDSLTQAMEWFVSSPGKVILFGEHAVVHGVTAIAASVDLRCYGLTSPRKDNKVSVHFHDIDNFYHEWDIDGLPWDAVTVTGPENHEELDQRLIEALSFSVLAELGEEQKQARNAALAFLYLYMVLSRGQSRPAFNFTARATLPVGAGLGSVSIVLSVCGNCPAPPAASHQSSAQARIHHLRPTSTFLTKVAVPFLLLLQRKSIAGRLCLRRSCTGNPSGVDNSVAVFGGALAYTRAGFGRKGGMEPIQGFKSLKFLLTNSKVPRDTKKLVAGVGEKKEREPELVNGSISDEARRALADPELSRDALPFCFEGSELIKENHEHLITLGVSHPRKPSSTGGLRTKLTGAGGGGCSVTLIPDGKNATTSKDEELNALIDELIREGFHPYLTSVGGSGLGILSPYPEHRTRGSDPQPPRQGAGGPATPPETPTPDVAERHKKQALASDPLRPTFETAATTDLAEWATGLGRWLYS
ncbi:cystathionine beta-lyase [Coprinopsis sp. MPI-PUGE-AT-0042]|nr:cystathionine beta-lyase [Coprinopsis sp. MPI-PUGE-AT-0042]